MLGWNAGVDREGAKLKELFGSEPGRKGEVELIVFSVRVRKSFFGRSGVDEMVCGMERETETGEAEVDGFLFSECFRR